MFPRLSIHFHAPIPDFKRTMSATNPFDDPTPGSARTSAIPTQAHPRMRSNLLPISLSNSQDKDEQESLAVPKPWLTAKNPRARISYWTVYVMLFVGIAVSVIQCIFVYKNALLDRQPLCLVLDENFDTFDEDLWLREVDISGFGNGQFDMTTGSSRNSFVKDGFLHIVPTLTENDIGADKVMGNFVYNATGCTFNDTAPDGGWIYHDDGSRDFDSESYYRSCSAISNATEHKVIRPAQSARLSTLKAARAGRKGASIRTGRVEVRAKLPHGDWLWPAIWMMPVDSVYGPWPRSGEIDMVESRGNSLRYTARGSNYVQGSLNWGPNERYNGVSKSYSWWTERRESFADGFHTYVLEWTDKFLRVYVDSRTRTLLTFPFKKSFWDVGEFEQSTLSDPTLKNPWTNGSTSAPFDQEFYLILNVGVGGSNGWFPDWQGEDGKPWINQGASPAYDFLKAKDVWYPTWGEEDSRGMVVDYVKMWEHCQGVARSSEMR